MALTISVGVNEREAVAGVKKIGKSVEELDSEFNKMADAGDSAFDDLAKSGDKAGKAIKKDVSGALKETADEAKQSGKEAAASFSGEFSDVGDFLQETVAQGFAGFGPIGLAAGLAGAAGIGVVMSAITEQQEAAKALGQYFADAYQAAADAGRSYIDAATIIGEANDIIFNPDRQGEYNRILEEANTIGLDANTLIRARAGDQEALNVVLAATQQKQLDVKAAAEEAGSTAIRLSIDEQNELRNVQQEYLGIEQQHKKNSDALATAQSVASGLHAAEREQIQRTKDASQASYEAMAARYANPLTVKMNVDDSAVRNYRPPVIQIGARIVVQGGGISSGRQLIDGG